MTRATHQATFWQHRRRLPPPLERRTHIALADLLRLQAHHRGWWWSHVGSGEHRTEQTGALLKRMGLRPGMLDFLLIAPSGQHHWLELKRGNAPLTQAQEAFIAELEGRGVPWFVARDYDAAVNQLKQWGALCERTRPTPRRPPKADGGARHER